MKLLRTLSTSRLLLLVLAVVVVGAGVGAVAVAASGGSGTTPAAKPLASALHDSLAGTAPEGITARIKFTNNLLPSSALSGRVGSALISGASGRLWATNDGHGRLELQSDAGDVQIVWNKTQVSVFDASSNTVYKAKLPRQSGTGSPNETTPAPAVAEIESFLTKLGAHFDLTGAQPDNVGGQPAYSVRIAPTDQSGLLGAAELAWDASRGVPLRVGIYAKGASSPVLELQATDISYGAVAPSVVEVAPPASAKVVDLGGFTTGSSGGGNDTKPITGLAAVQQAAPFTVAPATVGNRARQSIRLVSHGDSQTVVVVYGDNLGSLAVVERKAAAAGNSPLSALPEVTVNGVKAHELSTPLGTALTWRHGDVDFVLAGSVTQAAAEAAAADLG